MCIYANIKESPIKRIRKEKKLTMTMNSNKLLLPKELDDLLDTLVAGFASYMKVCDLVPKIMEVAKKYNIDDMTIRNTIITKLAKIGISKNNSKIHAKRVTPSQIS